MTKLPDFVFAINYGYELKLYSTVSGAAQGFHGVWDSQTKKSVPPEVALFTKVGMFLLETEAFQALHFLQLIQSSGGTEHQDAIKEIRGIFEKAVKELV